MYFRQQQSSVCLWRIALLILYFILLDLVLFWVADSARKIVMLVTLNEVVANLSAVQLLHRLRDKPVLQLHNQPLQSTLFLIELTDVLFGHFSVTALNELVVKHKQTRLFVHSNVLDRQLPPLKRR